MATKLPEEGRPETVTDGPLSAYGLRVARAAEIMDREKREALDEFVESLSGTLVGSTVFVEPLRLVKRTRPDHVDIIRTAAEGEAVDVQGLSLMQLSNRTPAHGLPEHVFVATDAEDSHIGFVWDNDVRIFHPGGIELGAVALGATSTPESA